VPTAAATRLSSVNLNNEQGSQFQPDFVYRGFEASPVSGVPQGIAVYQNGVRINEAFGDTVNWDLIPQFAVDRMTVQSNNPVFGLNALGGAVTLDMKNGFNFHGTDLQLSGGSFGNVTGYAEHGAQYGNFGFYGGIGGLHDDGFRYDSPANLLQGYMDLGWEHEDVTLHLSISGADNAIGATGPTPVQMLQQNPQSIFNLPAIHAKRSGDGDAERSYRASDFVLLSGDIYYRHFHQTLLDAIPRTSRPASTIRLSSALKATTNIPATSCTIPMAIRSRPVRCRRGDPGEIDHTSTNTNSIGAAGQASFTNPLFGHDNNLAIGAAIDHGDTRYSAYGELGYISRTWT